MGLTFFSGRLFKLFFSLCKIILLTERVLNCGCCNHCHYCDWWLKRLETYYGIDTNWNSEKLWCIAISQSKNRCDRLSIIIDSNLRMAAARSSSSYHLIKQKRWEMSFSGQCSGISLDAQRADGCVCNSRLVSRRFPSGLSQAIMTRIPLSHHFVIVTPFFLSLLLFSEQFWRPSDKYLCTISWNLGAFNVIKLCKSAMTVNGWNAAWWFCNFQDGRFISENGFLYGFDWVVWTTVLWYGIGGKLIWFH